VLRHRPRAAMEVGTQLSRSAQRASLHVPKASTVGQQRHPRFEARELQTHLVWRRLALTGVLGALKKRTLRDCA